MSALIGVPLFGSTNHVFSQLNKGLGYITFISTFPKEANMRDGYFRRVHYVDQAFQDSDRIHLDIRFGKNFRKRIFELEPNMRVMHLNALLHFPLIGSVLRKSGMIYIHSIAKIPSILLHLMRLNTRVPFALDLHGVMVEELKLARRPIIARFYSWIEKVCFIHSSLNIYVSEVMQFHFRAKYPAYRGQEVIFATNSNTNSVPTPNQQPATSHQQPLREALNISDNDVVFVYSGNCQPWQNIHLMLNVINKLTNPRFKFLILSGQGKRIKRMIRHRGIPDDKIQVISVNPEKLGSYYELAHYGFILRDDILVNRVANPTKLAEYLQYGIIPVVKLVNIGDYDRYGYDHISLDELNNELSQRRSLKNQDIYHEICGKYGVDPLRNAISETINNSN